MGKISQLAFDVGDSAVYFALAHEYSHSVQKYLGLLNQGLPTKTLELHADCLAGTFFAATKYAGVLEPGNLEEGMFSAFMHGDDKYVVHHWTKAADASEASSLKAKKRGPQSNSRLLPHQAE